MRRGLLLAAHAVGFALLASAAAAKVGPPNYHVCGSISLGAGQKTPVYAHNATCALARAVVKGCSASRRGTCFGQMPLPYNGHGEPYLPEAPSFKPHGFECYQTFPPYTAGLPPPPRSINDPKPILCHRDAGDPTSTRGIYQQLVAYVV